MHYTTHTEDFVKSFYGRMDITEPQQLNFQTIAERISIHVFYWKDTSQALFLKNHAYIFLNEILTPQQQWQDFCHELGHVLLHAGNQQHLPRSFVEYQEQKANNFMYHACMPTFMLDEMELYDCAPQTIVQLQQLFNVEYEFALKRLTQYINNKVSMLNWNLRFGSDECR